MRYDRTQKLKRKKMSNINSIGLETLKSYIGNNDADIIEMIALFLQITPSHVKQMKISLAQNDWQSLNYIAHQIKPSLDILGFQTAKAKASVIENLTTTGDEAELIKKMVDELFTLLDGICKDLNVLLIKLKKEH